MDHIDGTGPVLDRQRQTGTLPQDHEPTLADRQLDRPYRGIGSVQSLKTPVTGRIPGHITRGIEEDELITAAQIGKSLHQLACIPPDAGDLAEGCVVVDSYTHELARSMARDRGTRCYFR